MLNKYQAVTITSLDSIFSSIHTLFTTNIYMSSYDIYFRSIEHRRRQKEK